MSLLILIRDNTLKVYRVEVSYEWSGQRIRKTPPLEDKWQLAQNTVSVPEMLGNNGDCSKSAPESAVDIWGWKSNVKDCRAEKQKKPGSLMIVEPPYCPRIAYHPIWSVYGSDSFRHTRPRGQRGFLHLSGLALLGYSSDVTCGLSWIVFSICWEKCYLSFWIMKSPACFRLHTWSLWHRDTPPLLTPAGKLWGVLWQTWASFMPILEPIWSASRAFRPGEGNGTPL